MKHLELFITFRGMHPPAVKMTGKSACVFTCGRLLNGREQKREHTLFAYREGVVWKTFLVNFDPGKYRLTLMSNDLHCSQDVTIDDALKEQGILRVEFDRRMCRRKLTPLFLKKLWWHFRQCTRARANNPRRDMKVLARWRRRYRRGPVGSWLSSHDRLTLYGCVIEFRRDGTGTVFAWGDAVDASTAETEFRWRPVDDWAISVQPFNGEAFAEDWGIIRYDFKAARACNGDRLMLMYSTSNTGVNGELNFWRSAHPMELTKTK